MTRTEAYAIYNAGPEAVVKVLMDHSSTIESQGERISALENKIAELLKNSTNSGKRPSSDDITKPKSRKKDKGKGRKIGGQPGHIKHKRPLSPSEEI
ncbi:MAG: IS66 family transposase, partial [Gammaproteobacteria bacterium]|nr:IS66 family transposase [Gammaproteobacteria bacterium]